MLLDQAGVVGVRVTGGGVRGGQHRPAEALRGLHRPQRGPVDGAEDDPSASTSLDRVDDGQHRDDRVVAGPDRRRDATRPARAGSSARAASCTSTIAEPAGTAARAAATDCLPGRRRRPPRSPARPGRAARGPRRPRRPARPPRSVRTRRRGGEPAHRVHQQRLAAEQAQRLGARPGRAVRRHRPPERGPRRHRAD